MLALILAGLVNTIPFAGQTYQSACPTDTEAFYTCTPPAMYIPNPGHCEYPMEDSVPPPSYPIILCGVKAQ